MSYSYESAVDRFPDQYAQVWAHGVQGIEDRFERGLHDPGLLELLDDDAGELHQQLFNEDYFIIGYYQAEQWLKKDNGSIFEAIETIREYEQSNFGEVTTDISNPCKLINMLVYIKGEELLNKSNTLTNDYWDEYIPGEEYNTIIEEIK